MISIKFSLISLLILTFLSNQALAVSPLQQMIETPALSLAPEYARHLQTQLFELNFSSTLSIAEDTKLISEKEFDDVLASVAENISGLSKINEAALRDFALNFIVLLRLSKNGYYYAAEKQTDYLAFKALDFGMSLRANKNFAQNIDESVFAGVVDAMVAKSGFIKNNERQRIVSNFTDLYQSWTSKEYQEKFEKLTALDYDRSERKSAFLKYSKIFSFITIAAVGAISISSAISHQDPSKLIPLAYIIGPYIVAVFTAVTRLKMRKRDRNDLAFAAMACDLALSQVGLGIAK